MEATIDDIEIEEIIDLWDKRPERKRFPENRMNIFWKFTKKYPESFPLMKRYTGGNLLLPIEDGENGYKRAILAELKKEW